MSFKPMLSAKYDEGLQYWPALASPKIDGIRCIVRGGVALSRKLEPIPNAYVQSVLGQRQYNGLDGELVVGDAAAPDVYRKTNSGVMSRGGEPDFTFWCFDNWDMPTRPFAERLASLQGIVGPSQPDNRIHILPHETISDAAHLREFSALAAASGYEGVMLRDPRERYKFGRSTAREGGLIKVKAFLDAEAIVIGVEEEMHNANAATTDALGHTKRSSHQANKVGKGTMGALHVRGLNGPFAGVEFHIGSGFTAADRRETWAAGDVVTYKFFPHGCKDRPRHPVYLRRRDIRDVGVAQT